MQELRDSDAHFGSVHWFSFLCSCIFLLHFYWPFNP